MSDIKPKLETNAEEYRDAMHAILTCMKLISHYDLPGILNAIERCNAIGPIIDPTLYRNRGKEMNEDKEVIQSALPLWKMAHSLMDMKDD